MSNNEDFKFTRGDLVYVVDFGEQYLMSYKMMGELLGEAYDEPFLAHPITIGGSFKYRGHKEGEESFRVVSCGYLLPCYRSTKVYLLASEEELKKYKDRNCEEKDYYPFPVYVVDEEGLEEVKQKVFLVAFFPKSSKAVFSVVDGWYGEGTQAKNGEVFENFSDPNPKLHRLMVNVAAKDEDEAVKKGGELIKEYLTKKMNGLFEEGRDVEWILRRLKEKLEE